MWHLAHGAGGAVRRLLPLLVDKHVTSSKVPVDNALLVQVADTSSYLHGNADALCRI